MQQRANRLTFRIRRPGSLTRAGTHVSAMRGDGFSFVGFREYQFGDDVRLVDWNVTARSARPVLRVFLNARASPLAVVLDASASIRSDADKWGLARELTTLFSLMAVRDADAVGAVSVTDRVESVLLPRAGQSQVRSLTRWLDAIPGDGRGTRLELGIRRAMELLPRAGTLILVSDYLDASWDRALRLAAQRHVVVAITVVSNHDQELAPAGLVRVRDVESSRLMWIDTHSVTVRRAYALQAAEVRRSIRGRLIAAGAIPVEVPSDAPYLRSLSAICSVRGAQS